MKRSHQQAFRGGGVGAGLVPCTKVGFGNVPVLGGGKVGALYKGWVTGR